MTPGPSPMVDDARLERQLTGAFEGAAKIRLYRRVRRIAAIVALASSLVLLALFLRPRSAPPALALEGTVIETEGAQTLTLADGTRIDFGAHTRADFRAARPELVR